MCARSKLNTVVRVRGVGRGWCEREKNLSTVAREKARKRDRVTETGSNRWQTCLYELSQILNDESEPKYDVEEEKVTLSSRKAPGAQSTEMVAMGESVCRCRRRKNQVVRGGLRKHFNRAKGHWKRCLLVSSGAAPVPNHHNLNLSHAATHQYVPAKATRLQNFPQ